MSRKLFALFVLAILTAFPVSAQHGGGAPDSVVFFSARDDHPNNQIYIMSPDGGNPFRVTFDTASDVDPDLSPNGQEIVFASTPAGSTKSNIVLFDRNGVVRSLTELKATDEWPRWSPNGEQIVFDSNRDGVFEIYVMNADGTAVTRLTDPPLVGRYPSWSHDGKQIVFRRGIDIATINADGTGDPVSLTHEVAPSFAQMPVSSGDGKYVAFMSFREGYCSVFRMTIDGNEQINLTPKDKNDAASTWCSRAPAWSANRQEIFFMSMRPKTAGVNHIFVMNMDGTDLRQLTETGKNGSPRAGHPPARERNVEDDRGRY